MPRIAGEPLRKVTLNLFAEDVEWFQRHFGQGYSEHMRQAVRDYRWQVMDREEDHGQRD